MVTLRLTADVPINRQIVLTLPPEVPLGRADFVLTVESADRARKQPRTSLADWAEANAEHWGERVRSDDVEGFTGRRL